MYEILRIHSIDSLKNETLQERATKAHAGRSQEFIAVINEKQVGLLSYEDWSDKSLGFIYEIFVLPEFREQGIGASLLSYAENHAILLNCTNIQLKPYALEQKINRERLVAWYSKNGYVQKTDDPEKMEKILAAI